MLLAQPHMGDALMALKQIEVHEIVKQAVSKNVDIPEFQRQFVWEPEKVKFLAESLYRDYPVGSFLLWDCSDYHEPKMAQGAQASLWIVDGQQRTTALCLLLGLKPYWWQSKEEWNKELERYDVMVNVLPDQADSRLEFALPNPVRRQDPRWIGVRSVLRCEKAGALTELAEELAKQIDGGAGQVMELFKRIHAHLQDIWQIRQRQIPIVEIGHDVEDVAEIFTRLNREGTRVKEADTVLALAAVRNPGWVREDYLPYRSDLEDRGWDLEAGIFIRTMTGIGTGRARLKEVPSDFWQPQNINAVWKHAKAAISSVVKQLAGFGISCAELLPSSNSLIPLFVLHHRFGDKEDYSFNRALYWFLLANRDGRYSGSAITSLNEDVRTITNAADYGGALENLHSRLRVSPRVDESEFLSRYDRAGSRFLRLALYLVLFKREARDWVDGTCVGYDKTGNAITADFRPQWHHIYPRSMLRKSGMNDDDIHVLANITVLNEQTNVKKLLWKEPAEYIKQFSISSEALRSHLIPEAFVDEARKQELSRRWGIEHYTDFIVKRAHMIAKEVNTLLQALQQS